MKNQRILITGGAGYLGSVIARHFLERGDKVTCLDNLMYNQPSPIIFCSNPNYEFVPGDARDEKLVRELIKDKDVLVPLAAIVGMPICDQRPLDAQTINRDAVIMLNQLRGKGQKLIYPNTNSGYGSKSGTFHCNENTPLEPISLYGRTKCEAENAILKSDNAVVFRLATVFGVSPRMRKDLLVNNFVWIAMTSQALSLYEPNAVRNYIHIEDIGRVFTHAVDNFDAMKGKPYNVGLDDANLSKRQLADKVREHFPRLEITENMQGSDPDKRNYLVSNARIASTGFRPKFSLDDGIRDLGQAYKVLLKIDPYQNYS